MINQKSLHLERSKADAPGKLGTVSYLVIFAWSLGMVMLAPAHHLLLAGGLCFLVAVVVYPRSFKRLVRPRWLVMIALLAIPPVFFLGDLDRSLWGIPYSSLGLVSSIQIMLRIIVVLVSVDGFTSIGRYCFHCRSARTLWAARIGVFDGRCAQPVAFLADRGHQYLAQPVDAGRLAGATLARDSALAVDDHHQRAAPDRGNCAGRRGARVLPRTDPSHAAASGSLDRVVAVGAVILTLGFPGFLNCGLLEE